MSRRFDQNLLSSTLVLRARTLKVLNPASNKKVAAGTAELRSLVTDLRVVARKTAGLPESRAIRFISEALVICVHLSKWVDSTMRAGTDADCHLKAARLRAATLQEALGKPLAFPQTQAGLHDWVSQVAIATEVATVRALLGNLAKIPQPVTYSINHDPYPRVRRVNKSQAMNSESDPLSPPPAHPLAKLDFTIDGLPLVTPLAIMSGRQYGLSVRAEVIQCPPDQRILEIDYTTTMSASDFGLTPFALEMSGDDRRKSATASGQLIVRASQSFTSPPASFRIRARFVNSDRSAMTPAIVIGYNEMRVRALDQASYPILSRYPTVDIQIPKIIADVQNALPDLPPSDLDDFVNCLVCLGAYCGMVQQTGVFKSKVVDERRDFQQHLLQHLRVALGEDVREEETVAGGRLDLRYRRIVIELKVEKTIEDRTELRGKYLAQPAQYTAPSIPLAIICILDMTDKVNPPSNIANNITLETPTVHGFEGSSPLYPTKIAVVVIDGNLKNPSVYSKVSPGSKPKPKPKSKPSKKPPGKE